MIENANDLYTKYLDATTKLKITTEYIESALAAGGLTKADFDHLAQKHALGKQQKLKM